MKVLLNKTDYRALMDIPQVLWIIYFLTGNNNIMCKKVIIYVKFEII